MLIVMQSDCSHDRVEQVRQLVEGLGCRVRPFHDPRRPTLWVEEGTVRPDVSFLGSLEGVAWIGPGQRPLRHVPRASKPGGTRIRIGPITVGGPDLTVIAGPCAVEDEDGLLAVAQRMKEAGVALLRGGAYKPRTSPYDFQGLGPAGLKTLARVRDATGLPVITEAVDEASLELVEEYADVIQIGARNMQNYALLKRAGRSPRPVFLKRGFAASLEELLQAAEYLLDAGNEQVMLCERGIRTFSTHSRFTLDLAIVPRLKQMTHLPVFVDPSHASGMRDSVVPLARAAVAAGADGVMVEVHPDPVSALSDGAQALDPSRIADLVDDLTSLARHVRRQDEVLI